MLKFVLKIWEFVGQCNLTQDRDKRQAAHSKQTLVVLGFDNCVPVTSAIRGRAYVLVVMHDSWYVHLCYCDCASHNFIINCCSRVLMVREGGMYLCVCLRIIRRGKFCHCYSQWSWWIKLDREVTIAAVGGCCEVNELIHCMKKWRQCWGDDVRPVNRTMTRFVVERALCVCVCVSGRCSWRRTWHLTGGFITSRRTREHGQTSPVLSPTSILPSSTHP